jgi:hypothetical protein
MVITRGIVRQQQRHEEAHNGATAAARGTIVDAIFMKFVVVVEGDVYTFKLL